MIHSCKGAEWLHCSVDHFTHFLYNAENIVNVQYRAIHIICSVCGVPILDKINPEEV